MTTTRGAAEHVQPAVAPDPADRRDGPDWEPDLHGLSLERKVALLTGASAFTLEPEPSLGLGEVRLSDGPTGVRGLKFSGGRVVALFPNATLLASAWSEETAYEVGRLLAEEALAQQIHLVLGPTINLHRSLLGGRLFEAYSEDPLLSGRLAAAYVHGLQDLGVGACLKHLVANESETARTTVDSIVDEATLREVYLLPFEIAVQQARPWSVMAAYNDVNGIPATEAHQVITGILKGEWGYDGLVMSDWSATKSAGPAANAGLDLVMPGPDGPWGDALVAAVRSGEVSEPVVDEHLRRLLRLAQRVGALAPERAWPQDIAAPDSAQRREELTRLAAGGLTVLTNTDGALPLAGGARVALVGRHGIDTVCMGGGSAQVNPPYQVSIAEGLAALLGDRLDVVDGVEVRARPAPARSGFVLDPETGAPGVEVTLLAADGQVIETRHGAPAATVVGVDDDAAETVAAVRLRARLEAAGPVELGVMGVGSWTLRAGGRERGWELAVSGAGFAEELLSPPTATARVESGAGLLVEAEVRLGGAPMGMYALLAGPAARPQEEVLADAVRVAAGCDVAVVVVGLTAEQETESVDKTTLALPGLQDAMVSAVAAAAPRTVVVVNAATPVLMPWLDEVHAVLWAGLPGQEGGHAVAAALVGDVEPAGRLVTTFPRADGAAPAWSVTPVDGALRYEEGPFIGYRGHDAGRAPEPLFWLGHGLGYTTWSYAEARLSLDGPTPAVSVTVTNSGSRDGREVVQLYFRPAASDHPIRLVGWVGFDVDAGESTTVRVVADPRVLRHWDTAAGAWAPLPMLGRLLIARGLGDVRATLDLPPR